MKAGRRYKNWLPSREEGAPAWSARGTAMLDAKFQVSVILAVVAVLFAVGTTMVNLLFMVLGPVPAAFAGYGCFAAGRRLGAARRTGWRTAAVTIAGKYSGNCRAA